MTIWITGSRSANGLTPAVGVRTTRTLLMPFTISGLTPNSTYTFWVNNTNMTWATRQIGKKLGSGLLSDTNGQLIFEFHAEMNNNISGPDNLTKYYTFQLKDRVGNSRALSVMTQNLTVRT